ncbi:unnamed protein product [Peronospora belbahrii]|uniref:M96 mating-specific protein family n=1 Tax=Peronospora belbahrii TaxID=622444 RepID=A0ABN8CWL8_9STRA|nr:unnamed protein product [Peronospora belbahrii]
MSQDEVETLEAALNFITQYEMSLDEKQSIATMNGINFTDAFEHSLTRHNKSHSLEMPEYHHVFSHTPFLEMSQELDAGNDFFDSMASHSESQELPLDVSVHSTPCLTSSHVGSNEQLSVATASSLSLLQRRRPRLLKKEEISDLRGTVAELSRRLDQLQASSILTSPAAEERHVESIVSKPESLWQQVAARQLLLRQKAEEANLTLRKLVETQVRQTKNLKRMLSRRNDAETLALVGLKRRKQRLVTELPPKDNEEVFAALLQGTDELYVGLDKLYYEKGMQQVPCPGRKRQVQRDAVNGAIVVFLDKNQVPFDMHKTQSAVWKLLSGRHRKDSPYTQGTIDWEAQESGNTVTKYVSFTCVAGNVSALLQVREVARKYVTEDRATFICRSIMEPKFTGEDSAMGLKFDETMTVVVRRGEPLSSGQDTAIIESYLCATRHDEDTALARKFREEVYVDIAIEGWEQSYSSHNQEIENILFDESIQVG